MNECNGKSNQDDIQYFSENEIKKLVKEIKNQEEYDDIDEFINLIISDD